MKSNFKEKKVKNYTSGTISISGSIGSVSPFEGPIEGVVPHEQLMIVSTNPTRPYPK
jgi:hypothetical protein